MYDLETSINCAIQLVETELIVAEYHDQRFLMGVLETLKRLLELVKHQ